ncbi:EF-hand domain-containing protein [Scleromatobacter humisilvae]|uniref:EF-hand domain-containing protein n=1 Tax=Scleromatobacter humisilvae TaxID=2897159 RepID=A0A9X2C458_9BURK|nr:EF-hand domain-containing protein [Scleromatobacter humisilvae]MCK9688715.1 EF-hand domain-containing protein [Scleromatobacter humisilvae]
MRNVLAILALLAAASAQAGPFLDPGRPPAAAQQAAQAEGRVRPASVGAALDSDALAHLHASFDAADTAHRGTLSRAEAQAGGFGWIANHFDAIDTAHAGRVSFDDVARYLAARRAGSATK